MPSDNVVFGSLIVAVAIGLASLVYGMQVSAGQAMNTPAIAGGVVILAAIGLLVLRIVGLETPH